MLKGSVALICVIGGLLGWYYLRPLPDLEKPCWAAGGTYYEGRDSEGKVKLRWCEKEGRVYQGRQILKLKTNS